MNKQVRNHSRSIFTAGFVAVALWNLLLWRRDRDLAHKITAPQVESVAFKSMPKVSVLVAAWNESLIIEQHIQSFKRLRYPNKELILCAGGDDDTYQLTKVHSNSTIIVIEQQPGEGKQNALARCMERATGEVIYLTDADCLLNDAAFERLLLPIINEHEAAATGTSAPIFEQREHPYVQHRWFTDFYVEAHQDTYTTGLLGRNCALRRETLKAIGGFSAEVYTGTDYHMAKSLMAHGYRIRFIRDSVVETIYAETGTTYQRQQTRWLRNVVIHGLRTGAYSEVIRCLMPSLIGLTMLAAPVVALIFDKRIIVGWGLAWAHMLFSRVRYLHFGKLILGKPLHLAVYLKQPLYALMDFAIWAVALPEYILKSSRWRW